MTERINAELRKRNAEQPPRVTHALGATDLARIWHEANKAYCESLGDYSQKPWAEAEEWQRVSVTKGVVALLDGSAPSPREQHERWLEHKRAEGWTYGEVKDTETKTHPALVEYDDLPVEQRRKDYLGRAIILALTLPYEAYTGEVT